MPITISDKRKSAIYAAIHRQITDLRLRLIREKPSNIDHAVAQVENSLYKAVIAAAEGRTLPS